MYFAGDKYNEIDPWRNSTARADALTVDPTPRADGSEEATFDIVMMRA